MRVCIAEKPSLARAIASCVGADFRDGNSLTGNGWRVCWLHGHVIDLACPDEYAGRGWDGRWSEQQLPMIPTDYIWRANEQESPLVEEICRYMDDPTTTEVVHAGDPDREGEGIVRRIFKIHPPKVPVMRLWAASTEPAAIERALANLRPDAELDGLGAASDARAIADWLIGMNASRALTVSYGPTVHAGRVKTATLHLIAERTRRNREFKEVPFWTVRVSCGDVEYETRRYETRDDADAAAESMRDEPVSVVAVEHKTKRARPPRLYNLNDMQRDASRVYGIPAARSMAAAQALYEAGLQTYPRTESRALTTEDARAARNLIEKGSLSEVVPASWSAAARLGMDAGRLVDESAVAGHPALMPTALLTGATWRGLSDDEKAISALVASRLLAAATGADSVREIVKVTATIADIEVTHSSSLLVETGWESVVPKPKTEDPSIQPRFEGVEAGAALKTDAVSVHEGKTKPPSLFTDDTLLAAMAGADKLVSDASLAVGLRETDSHSGGIGTPATRTRAISELETCGYIARRGSRISATDDGIWADSIAPENMRSPDLTAWWEIRLGQVENGELAAEEFIREAEDTCRSLVASTLANVDRTKVRTREAPTVGPCPRCGKPMRVNVARTSCWCTSKSFGPNCASGDGCGFSFAVSVRGHKLTDAEIGKLLSGRGVTITCRKKDGTGTYRARVTIDEANPYGTSLELLGPGGSGKSSRRGPGGAGRRRR
ncbi:MAG: DNA topoisomerase [Collinsella sp.]|nr:DNA topoisomerase [Collinsella sp.]